MNTPESNKATPSTVVKDSPVYSYLSSLSPLKLVDERPSMQLYGDTSYPTPELVFTSPHLSLRRSQHLGLSDLEKVSSGDEDRDATLSENGALTPLYSRIVKLVPCTMNNSNVDGPSQGQPCSSPSTCVDGFLADPSENCDNSSGSPDPHLKQATESAKVVQDVLTNADENQTKFHNVELAQACVPVDESMAGSMEHSASTSLPDLNSRQPIDPPQALWSKSNSTGEIITKLQAPNAKICTNTKYAVSSSSAYEEKSVTVHLGENESNMKVDYEVMKTIERSLDVQLKPVSENVSVNANSSIDTASSAQLDRSPVDQDAIGRPFSWDSDVGPGKENPNNICFFRHGTNDGKVPRAETVQCWGSDSTPRLLPGSVENILVGDSHLEDSGAISNTFAENHIQHDQEEGGQYQRGMRKRLEFEAAENCRMSPWCKTNSWMPARDISNQESSFEMETSNAFNKESIATFSNKQLIQSSGKALVLHNVDNYGRNIGSLPVAVHRHFGLHLNSIGSASPMNFNVSLQLPDKDVCVQGEKLFSRGIDQVSQYPPNYVTSMSLIGHHAVNTCASSDSFSPYSATENSEEEEQGNQAINVQISRANYPPPLDVKPLSSTSQLKPNNCYMTPCSMKRPVPEDDSSTVSTERSPMKKRQMKKASEKEGCKRCNCKRSKCLKLYCECFAAGVVCSEACACQACSNMPEHAVRISEARQKIESRNPLAFAPKVVVRDSNPPKDSADTERKTPTSARHKRGCNCKKSECLKKYCECFQAGVGCSLGCRCEGCRNTFGRNDGSEVTEIQHRTYEDVGLERDPSVSKLCGMEVKRGLVKSEHCYSHFSPPTPLFQVSNGNDAPNSQIPAKYYPSSESGTSVSPSYEESPSSPVDSISSNILAKETVGTLSLVPYNQDLGCHTAVQADSFPPEWEGFPLPNLSPHDSGTSAGSKTRRPRTLHARMFERSSHFGSFRCHNSPVTPLPRLGERKFVTEPDSDSGLHNNHQDDTPEILKDTSPPLKVVTAGSPNQKRVSPPHNQHEVRSSSSPGPRGGRKFILQSVPSFPPLTPYSNDTRRHGT